jgi:hypothetical protein
MWKEAVMASLKVLFQQMTGGTEENHKALMKKMNLQTKNQTWDLQNM